MATGNVCYGDTSNSGTQKPPDLIKNLYKVVNEDETPLPRSWSSRDRFNSIGLSEDNLRVYYKGPGVNHKDAASVRATHPIPPACGLYYYEVKIVSKGRDGYMGIGLSAQGVSMNRLPGWDKHSYGYHGDDGHSFCSSGTGQPYGPTFTTGDVIGCGINLIDNICFYTKNGHYLGVAFTDLPPNLYPTVGLQTPGEVIDGNFGQAPFVFDIKEMVRELQNRERTTIKSFPVTDTYGQWQTILHRMVSTYLVHHGYCATAEAFARSTSQDLEEELTSIRNRQKIQKLVLSGRLGEVIKLVKELYPGLLEKNANLLFMLTVRQFIEMVNGSESDVDCVSEARVPSSEEASLPRCDSFSLHRRSRTPTPPPSPSGNSCWTNGKISEASKTAQPTSVIQSTKNIMSSLNHSNTSSSASVTLSTEELNNQRNAQESNASVIHSTSSNSSTANGTSPIINPPPPDPIINNPIPSTNTTATPSCSNSISTTSSTSHINDSDVEMDYAEAGSSTAKAPSAIESNGYTNGFGKHEESPLDPEEDMDVETNSRMMCRGNPAAIERMLFLGRELQQMSVNLRRELGRNKQNKTMLQDAFSLLAYYDPWNSPVGWQLDPIQREPVCQALNSAILESHQLPRRPPLEISVSHTKQLIDLMSRSGLGSCAFASVEAILHRVQNTTNASSNSNIINCSSQSSTNSSSSSSTSSSSSSSVCPEQPLLPHTQPLQQREDEEEEEGEDDNDDDEEEGELILNQQ